MRQVGALNSLAERYKDHAEFFVIYIREAHPIDGERRPRSPDGRPVKQPTSFKERCGVAERCVKHLELKMPCLIDTMDNQTEDDYAAFPDRLFVVDEQGKIAVRGEPGPKGFDPQVVAKWLHQRFPEVELSEPNRDGEKTAGDEPRETHTEEPG